MSRICILVQLILFLRSASAIIEFNEKDDWANWDDGDDWGSEENDDNKNNVEPSGSTKKRPHIIFILVDDWGWNDVGYHNPDILTPNIDKLASEGLTLEQNYVAAYCTPSRAALLTGMDPYHIGRQKFVITARSLGGLTLEKKLLPQYLKELNYSTHIVGKWHLGHCNPAYLPTNRGFDSQYGIVNSGGLNYFHLDYQKPYPYDFFVDGIPTRNYNIFNTFQMDLYNDKAISLINEHAKKSKEDNPMFLYLAFTSNHFPVEAPPEYLDMYKGLDDSKKRRSYMAMTTHMDNVVGNVVKALKDTKMYDDSIIVLMSDNGAYQDAWEYLKIHGGGSNYPLRGQKGLYFEGGTRVPALINSPYLKYTGKITNKIVHVTDWLPTLITAAGGNIKDYPELSDIDGIDQYDTLFKGSKAVRQAFVYNVIKYPVPQPDKNSTVLHATGAVRYGKWKILNFGDDAKPLMPLGTFQLYDLKTDPEEKKDLFEEEPEIAKRMVEIFEDAAASNTKEDFGWVPNDKLKLIIDREGNQFTNFCNLDGSINEDAHKDDEVVSNTRLADLYSVHF